MKIISSFLTLFITLASSTFIPDENYITNPAHDALRVLKEYHPKEYKYTYKIPKGIPSGETFFHEYFEYASETTDPIKHKPNSDSNGILIELSDNTNYFFETNEVHQYGKKDFSIPYGLLRQVDEDCFDEVISNWTNPQITAFGILETLASENNVDALRILADIYSFGFFDVEVNLSIAKDYYERILQLEPDFKTEAHAHFMLGVFYSTGLFGKFEKNEAKGLIHYQFASDLGSMQAQMALGHKYMFGVNVRKDEQMAIYYFSLVFNKCEELLKPYKTEVIKNSTETYNITTEELLTEPPASKFSIRWTDVDGGLYGDQASESAESTRMFETFDAYDKLKTYPNGGLYDDSEDYSVLDDAKVDAYSLLYFSAQKNYNGDYLHARDFDSAFQYAEICVANGFQEEEISNLLNDTAGMSDKQNTESLFSFELVRDPSPLAIFVGRCSQYLGHMYFLGQGTEIDYQKAMYYLNIGKFLSKTKLFKNDVGLMRYYGLGEPPQRKAGESTFNEHLELSSSKYYTAIAHLDMDDLNLKNTRPNIVNQEIYALLASSASRFTLARRKIIQLYEAGRLRGADDIIVGYYNSYLKLFEDLFFDFKIPFFALINANENDTTSNHMWTALVGMAVESELGYESAQSSLGSLLYPTVGNFRSKKYVNSLDNYSKIYTAKRYQEAISYFELSARHSNRDSINFLGDLYYNGLYNAPEFEDSIWSEKWWSYILPVEPITDHYLITVTKSIFGRVSEILKPFTVRISSLFGWNKNVPFNQRMEIIPKDLAKSISYYQDSASMWSQIGSYNVGWAYEYGVGVVQDLHLAKRYYDNVLTVSDTGYIAVKIAVIRIKLKSMLWNFLGCDGHGVKELDMDHRTWKQRLVMIFGWLTNNE